MAFFSYFSAWDDFLFHYFSAYYNYGALVPVFLLQFAIFSAKYLILLILLHAIFLLCYNYKKRPKILFSFSLRIALSWGISLAAVLALSYFCYRARPFILRPEVGFLPHRDSSSMPSDHALFFTAYSYFLLKYVKFVPYSLIWCALCLFAAIAIAWSRVFLGIHYPFDVIAGVIMGLLFAYLADKICNKFSSI